ncbi:1508_t:CDS:2 [Funneliformis caledonium]|uniref:1508_t:CDS:1 n=1 Tax=Funneliformis caledonium TaxID=1117310 RepID=A0A9N8Z8Q3_9GLOM|nr:1508_t:CDS:2 [Funneliformis caledonium]
MSKNSPLYVMLCLLIQLLVKINCQAESFRPSQRKSHTATLIDNVLYILGGINDDDDVDIGKEFFYLDVSIHFNTQNLSWNNLTNINILPSHYDAASVTGGVNNDKLLLYGGSSDNIDDLFYVFDTKTNSWSNPEITGDTATHKCCLTGIIDFREKIYLFGGDNDSNDMLILDTVNLNRETGSSINAPTPRSWYAAVLLPNQQIIYLGGYDGSSLSLNEIYIYDTINDIWGKESTSGKIPSQTFRDSFSAVLDNDLKPNEALCVLDLTNFEWYVPSISGTLPSSRFYHQANIIGNYMVVSFGSSIGGILLFFGGLFLYKWNKNKKESKTTLGDETKDDHENTTISTTNHEQVILQIPGNENYNHEREATPSFDDQGKPLQNIDTILDNFKNEILQAVRQEITQTLGKDAYDK